MKKHLSLSTRCTLARLLLAISATSLPLPGSHAQADDLLQVFLQGSSAKELTALVEQHGGVVTHSLHIIDAVGAKVSGAQLAQIVDSPRVDRFMDDLADSEIPGTPNDEEKVPCRVRGSIELDFQPGGISWRLYNKHEQTATMESITFDWPDSLGDITSITVGEAKLPERLYSGLKETSLELKFTAENGPEIDGMERFTVSFETPPSAATTTPLQRDFDLEASFFGPCSTDLVPGYENNHEDYYYNTAGGVDELHRQGLTGKGVTIAVVDSGLWEHELLRNNTKGENRLLATYDAITDTEGGELLDESGHGTHMTSIIANSGKTLKNGEWTGTYKGVAPDANLVAVKVLDRQGLAHMLDIIRGVQWVVDHREEYGIDVMNLSFSQDPRWPHHLDPVSQSAEKALFQGILVVAAAGNSGPHIDTVGSPGNVPEILTVGLVTDSWTPHIRTDDYIPDFSAGGPTSSGHVKPDLVAFGAHMAGLIPIGSALHSDQPEDLLSTGEFVSTGTSQAAAFVSGAAAIFAPMRPGLSPRTVKCILQTSAQPAISADGRLAYTPFRQGSGQISIIRALLFGTQKCAKSSWGLPISDGPIGPTIRGIKEEPLLAGLQHLWPDSETAPEKIYWGVKTWVESTAASWKSLATQPENASDVWMNVYQAEKQQVEDLSDNKI